MGSSIQEQGMRKESRLVRLLPALDPTVANLQQIEAMDWEVMERTLHPKAMYLDPTRT
jgi:hypothetical protein